MAERPNTSSFNPYINPCERLAYLFLQRTKLRQRRSKTKDKKNLNVGTKT